MEPITGIGRGLRTKDESKAPPPAAIGLTLLVSRLRPASSRFPGCHVAGLPRVDRAGITAPLCCVCGLCEVPFWRPRETSPSSVHQYHALGTSLHLQVCTIPDSRFERVLYEYYGVLRGAHAAASAAMEASADAASRCSVMLCQVASLGARVLVSAEDMLRSVQGRRIIQKLQARLIPHRSC